MIDWKALASEFIWDGSLRHIEFDLDPRDVRGQRELDGLVELMQRISFYEQLTS